MCLPNGAATGIGSLPGTDVAEAQRVVLGELPDLPHLPELPARGAGADLIGRGAALLVDLPVEFYAARWRLASRGGPDLRVALDHLERDLDTLTEQASEYGGMLKVQAVGPWTLAASLELPIGGVALRDPGAARDLAASLADGIRAHVAEVRARVPRATVLVQLDEPSLPAVLAGRIPTESGLGTLRAVDPVVARAALTAVVDAAAAPVIVHCCAPGVPFALIAESGAVGVAVDFSQVVDGAASDTLDALGQLIDDGRWLFAGVVDPVAGGRPDGRAAAGRVFDLWRRLGFAPRRIAGQVVVTPACGLAGATAAGARSVLAACRDAGRRLAEE